MGLSSKWVLPDSSLRAISTREYTRKIIVGILPSSILNFLQEYVAQSHNQIYPHDIIKTYYLSIIQRILFLFVIGAAALYLLYSHFNIKSPSNRTSLKMMGLKLLVFMASICLENSIPQNDLPVVHVLSPRQVKWAFYLRHKEKKD